MPSLRLGQKLDVAASATYGGMAVSTWSATAGEGNLFDFNRSKSATIGTQSVVASADFLGAAIFRGSDGTAFINSASIEAYVDGTPGTNDMPGRLVFKTTADGAASLTERMRIDSAGVVHVGDYVVTDVAKLAVNAGTANINPVYIYNNNATYAAMIVQNAAVNGYGIYDNVSDLHYLAGKLGVGIVPTQLLTVGSTAGNAIYLGTADSASGVWIRNDGSNMVFSTNVGDMFIGYSGNTSKTIHLGNGNPGVVQITGSATAGTLTVGTGGVKFISAGTSAVHVCMGPGNALMDCSSSLRYKENVKDLVVEKDKVLALRPVSFKWKARDEDGVGLIAEEVEKQIPGMVFYKNGLVEGVNYDQLSVYLLDVVRNMDSDIKSLRAENDVMQLKIKVLEEQ